MAHFINVSNDYRDDYNKVVSHPLQSYKWGEFREKTGVKVIRRALVEDGKFVDGFTLTLHKVPKLPYNIGYLPKGNMPTKELIDELYKIGKENNCIFIQIEPSVLKEQTSNFELLTSNLRPSFHPLFTRYTFLLDLTKSEEELLTAMYPKTRYNIKVAQKHGVEVIENNSDEAFETYLKLTFETTKRQKFYAHNQEYHRKMWNTLAIKNSNIETRSSKQIQNMNNKKSKRLKNLNFENSKIVSDFGFPISDLNKLSAHLLVAKYSPHPTPTSKLTSHNLHPIPLVCWILFVFHDTLYYPYGASASEYRETMASNLMMWEAIKFGKKLGLKKFDMWGALGPNHDSADPWYGFHRFKQGYGGELIEFIGSYDLVISPIMYGVLKVADRARWIMLNIRRRS